MEAHGNVLHQHKDSTCIGRDWAKDKALAPWLQWVRVRAWPSILDGEHQASVHGKGTKERGCRIDAKSLKKAQVHGTMLCNLQHTANASTATLPLPLHMKRLL